MPQAVPLNLDIWSHTFAFAVHEFLPHVSHAFYFSCYLLGSHSSCLNDLFQLISEHTHSFQILQATLDPSTFTLDTRHSTIDNILGSHQTYYIQHFPLSTLHFTLYTARPTCYTLRRITFALHTLLPCHTFHCTLYQSFLFSHNHDSGVFYHARGHSGSWASFCTIFLLTGVFVVNGFRHVYCVTCGTSSF